MVEFILTTIQILSFLFMGYSYFKGRNHGKKIYIICFIPFILLILYIYFNENSKTVSDEFDLIRKSFFIQNFNEEVKGSREHELSKDNELNTDSISGYSARSKIGESVKICDTITGIKPFKKGTYLNFGDLYPNNSFTIVLWNIQIDDSAYKFKVDDFICVKGTITSFNSKPQIQVNDINEITH